MITPRHTAMVETTAPARMEIDVRSTLGEVAQPTTPGPPLTVIVPIYNEAATLDEALRQIFAAPYEKQVIAVDDGSTDDTPAILEVWRASSDLLVITHPQNRGKGAAIRSALPYATGTVTIIQDADLEQDPAHYGALVEPVLRGEAGFAIGFRLSANAPRRFALFRLGVSVLNACVRVLYGVRLRDEACCYKVLRTDVLRAMDLQCTGFEFCPEVVAKACRMGLPIHEAPVTYFPRSIAAGKKIRYADGLTAIKTLWRLRKWTPPEHAAK